MKAPSILYSIDLPEPSADFRNSFDAYLELCGFKLEEKLGILFYLGAILPGRLVTDTTADPELRDALRILSLYSRSTCDFRDYEDLDQGYFGTWIYNANLVITKMTKDRTDIDAYLRKGTQPSGTATIIGKFPPMVDLLDRANHGSFSLKAIHDLLDEVFLRTGCHLMEHNYTCSRAYEAGTAYRMMMTELDGPGTDYLLTRIERAMPPLFQALFHTPVLYIKDQEAFKKNHLFSQILNHLYGGSNSPLYPIAQAVHRYHQHVFYKQKGHDLREEWDFSVTEDLAIRVFLAGLHIRDTPMRSAPGLLDRIERSGELYNAGMINATVDINAFGNGILEVLWSKYGVYGYGEFREGRGTGWETRWNNKGEYIQFLVLLYYETALHALVVKEVTSNE
jgi:hypothetical protein